MIPLLIAIEALHARARSRGRGEPNGFADEDFGLCGSWRKLEESTEGAKSEVQRGDEDVSHERECESVQNEICSVMLDDPYRGTRRRVPEGRTKSAR